MEWNGWYEWEIFTKAYKYRMHSPAIYCINNCLDMYFIDHVHTHNPSVFYLKFHDSAKNTLLLFIIN